MNAPSDFAKSQHLYAMIEVRQRAVIRIKVALKFRLADSMNMLASLRNSLVVSKRDQPIACCTDSELTYLSDNLWNYAFLKSPGISNIV
jgi:hypothetical protein